MIESMGKFKNIFVTNIDTPTAIGTVNFEYDRANIVLCATKSGFDNLFFRADYKTVHAVITIIPVIGADTDQTYTSK